MNCFPLWVEIFERFRLSLRVMFYVPAECIVADGESHNNVR
jgi:hypothetical protein